MTSLVILYTLELEKKKKPSQITKQEVCEMSKSLMFHKPLHLLKLLLNTIGDGKY